MLLASNIYVKYFVGISDKCFPSENKTKQNKIYDRALALLSKSVESVENVRTSFVSVTSHIRFNKKSNFKREGEN